MNLSVRDTANLLSVSEKTIYRWIKLQTIPAYRVQISTDSTGPRSWSGRPRGE